MASPGRRHIDHDGSIRPHRLLQRGLHVLIGKPTDVPVTVTSNAVMETPCASTSAGVLDRRIHGVLSVDVDNFILLSEIDSSSLGSNVPNMQGRNAVREDALAGFTQLVNTEVAPAVSLAVGNIKSLHGVAPALDHEGDCIIPREAH